MEPNSLPSLPALAVMRELEALEPGLAAFGARQVVARDLFELRATGFELRHIGRRGERRLALGQQEVAGIARTHRDAVAQVAQIGHFLQKNDVHRWASVLVGVRQQRQEARALDRRLTAGAGRSSWCR